MKLLASVDHVTGKIIWCEDEEYTAATFLKILKQVLEAYPTGKIVIVLDNARIHYTPNRFALFWMRILA
ncbi:transposase [Paenibacillus alvei]|uniref:transposase n=1 Tax=Paenibacillus alvei TaxID=44250 RepID=UPI0038293242|nr:transposase [Paenibacillus alvei]